MAVSTDVRQHGFFTHKRSLVTGRRAGPIESPVSGKSNIDPWREAARQHIVFLIIGTTIVLEASECIPHIRAPHYILLLCMAIP